MSPKTYPMMPVEVSHRHATVKKYTGRKTCFMCGSWPARPAIWECTVRTQAGPASQWLCEWHKNRWQADTHAKEIA